MTPTRDFVSLSRAVGVAWLQRGLRADVHSMRPLRHTPDSVARAPYAVHAIGVGPKEVAGRLTSTLAIRAYVVQKVARRAMSSSARIPSFVDGVPVDVIESPPAFMSAGQVATGGNIGRVGARFGTVGAFCRSLLAEDENKVLVLSNNHVLAGSGGRPGDPIHQRASDDAVEKVGSLLRAWPVEPGIIANRVDAAVASLDGAGQTLSFPTGVEPLTGVAIAKLNTIVCKFGGKTGLTDGVITDVNCTSVVGFDKTRPELKATFIGQIRIDRRLGAAMFADGGDSGSVVFEQGVGRAVGLFFAGPVNGSYGLANHIGDVIDRLQIRLLT